MADQAQRLLIPFILSFGRLRSEPSRMAAGRWAPDFFRRNDPSTGLAGQWRYSAGAPQGNCEYPHQSDAARIALPLDLAEELAGVVTALIPALEQIPLEGIQLSRARGASGSKGQLALQIAADRFRVAVQVAGNRFDFPTLLPQGMGLGGSLAPPISGGGQGTGPVVHWRRWRRGADGWNRPYFSGFRVRFAEVHGTGATNRCRDRTELLLDGALVIVEDLGDGLGQILQ